MREPCRVRHVERAEHGTVSRKPAVCRVMQVRVGQIRLSVAGVSVVLGGGWPTDRGSGRQGPGRASNMSVSPVAEVPQPAEAPTPAVPDAPVAPAVPDPGTPAAPEEPSTVPGPDEPAAPIAPNPGPDEAPEPERAPQPGLEPERTPEPQPEEN